MFKKFSLILIFILIIGTMSSVIADNGTYTNGGTVILNESGTNVSYDSICIDKDMSISNGQKVVTTNNITVKEGTIEVFLENWQRNMTSAQQTALQNAVWNVSENKSLSNVTYLDYYSVNKTYDSDKITTIVEKDGKNYTVTKFISYIDEFVFRMVGDGHGKGIQDLLVYLVNCYDTSMEIWELIPNECPPCNNTTIVNNTTVVNNTTIIVNNTTIINNICNNTIINNPVEIIDCIIDKNVTPEPQTSATMKSTGIPIIAILIVLLSSLGISMYRRR